MKRAKPRSALEELCAALDAAHALARALPQHESESQEELLAAVATAHFCAHRLAAEQSSVARRARVER